MPFRRRSPTRRLLTQGVELAFGVPEVVARRAARIAMAGAAPSAHEREELLRMTNEKVAALYEAWNGMVLAVWRANLHLLLSSTACTMPWGGIGRRQRRRIAQRTAVDILASGVTPFHRRVMANAKRLRK
jgi:hypothetical protein